MTSFGAWVDYLVTLHQLSDNGGVNFLLCFNLTNGCFILDDVLIQKPYAKWIIGLYDQYDHPPKQHVKGNWHTKGFVKHYRTKNQITRLLIYKLSRQGISLDKSYLVCDNWYASKVNLRFFAKRVLPMVTRLKKNG